MAMNILDRIVTIVATATITSAVWIVGGGSLIEMADSDSQKDVTRPAEAAPSPVPKMAADGSRETFTVPPSETAPPAPFLDRDTASSPDRSETRGLMIPVLNIRASDLSDTFSTREGAGAQLHEALDIMAPAGTTVVSAAPGTIEKLYASAAGGKTIYVRSEDRLTIHYYAHLQDYAQGLREGQRVRRGQRLGSVGNTGNAEADSPHLHFAMLRTTKDAEWWEPANAVNPYPILTRNQN